MTRAIKIVGPEDDRGVALPGTDAELLAEALAAIRADHLFERTGIADPHARLFATDRGRDFVDKLERADRVFVPYTLARFRFFAEKIAKSAERYRQVVIVGAGFDTRPLWLPGMRERSVRVFEVDEAAVLDHKRRVLAANDVNLSENLVPVAALPGDPRLPTALEDAGFDAMLPTAVFIEGVLFHLPAEATAALLDPGYLGLQRGSAMTFDYWPSRRSRRLNDNLLVRGASKIFGAFPFADDPLGLSQALTGIGHAGIAIVPLATLAERLWLEEVPYRPHGDWRVITTEVA